MVALTRLFFAACVLLALVVTAARADVGTYAFSSGTGTAYDLSSGATSLFDGSDECNGRNIDDESNNAVNIGFTFRYDGVDYTKFSASTNGLIGLFRSWGSTSVSKCWVNLLNQTSGGCSGTYAQTLDSIPQIAIYWDDLRVPGVCNRDGFNGSIRYKVFGSAPNRVLVIEYKDFEWDYYYYQYATMQVRLYEGSNKIEMWYTGFDTSSWDSDGGSIGLAAVGGTSYLSVTPGSPATVSNSSVDNSVDPRNIADNTLYTFAPCALLVSGSVSQGGSVSMANGDTLFASVPLQLGSSVTLQPFTITNPAGACPSKSFTFEIIGGNASDFQISTTGGTLAPGESISPSITITPGCYGTRTSTLRMTTTDGIDRTYLLRVSVSPQASFSGNVSQGGTASLTSGDTLFSEIVINRGTTISLQPMTITNTNTSAGATSLPVTFTLDDPTGQYSISTTSATLTGSQTVTPTITFSPTGVAHQEATLTVTAGCDVRTYLLRAFSAAPGGIFLSGSTQLDSSEALFVAQLSCVGSQVNAMPIVVRNTGNGPFVVTGISIYRTDTTVMQGSAPHALLRDALNQPIPSRDYMVMLTPGSAPLTPDQALALPFIVPEGQERTIYVVFVGQESGRRFARAYVQTNGMNLLTNDANGIAREGLARFDLVARAVGAQLSATTDGRALKPVVLPSVAVDDTSFATFTIANSGACDLLIRRDKLRITSGDINEFALVEIFPATAVDPTTNSYRIPAGASDRITVRFTPSRSGTRMATLFIQTNDSSIWVPGLTERGSRRLDLYGFGKAGLDATPLVLRPVAVGGTVSGVATLENSSTAVVELRQITIIGEDAAQFRASTTQPWPAMPARVAAGAKLQLAVELTPTGAAGARRAALELITTTNDTIIVPIRGEAGIAELSVSPTSLFDNVSIPVGQFVRQTVTIVNTGTFPVRLQTPTITGTDVVNYSIGALPRLDLAPGQTEYLEVTFSPQAEGSSSATLEIPTNIGTYSVQLGGASASAYEEKDPSRESVKGSNGSATTGPELR